MQKMMVFISHIAEEAEIAQSLKKLLETSFLGIIEVFVSSDANSLHLGQKWLDHVTTALKSCKVEIVIASPISVKRPWINFEAGGGWILDIPVIPLCHSGMTPSNLPKPLNDLHACLATDKTKLAGIVPVLAQAIDCNEPHVDWAPFITTVQKHETEYKKESADILALEEKAIVASDGLLHYELDTLLLIGENSDDQARCPTWQIMREMEASGYKKLTAKLGIASLTRKGLITSCVIEDHNGDQTLGVEYTSEGWNWIEINRIKLALDKKKEAHRSDPSSDGDIPF